MTRWCDRTACRTCPRRKTCPPEYRARKKAKAAKATAVSHDRVHRALKTLASGWKTPYEVGCAVMRNSITMSGMRVLARMEELGYVRSSPNADGGTSYRLSTDGEEALGCTSP